MDREFNDWTSLFDNAGLYDTPALFHNCEFDAYHLCAFCIINSPSFSIVRSCG